MSELASRIWAELWMLVFMVKWIWGNSLDKNPSECWNESAAERLLPEQAAMLLRDCTFWHHTLGQRSTRCSHTYMVDPQAVDGNVRRAPSSFISSQCPLHMLTEKERCLKVYHYHKIYIEG